MKKILAVIVSLALSLSVVGSPVLATSPASIFGEALGKDNAIILKNCAEQESENAIFCILKIVLDVMTVAAGILGVIGISVSGIQYLTAGGNEEKTRKSKRRIFEIVIGLAVYVAIYAILQFILPSYG